MKTLCYSVRLESLVRISDKAFKATAFDGEEFSKSWEPVYEDEPIKE